MSEIQLTGDARYGTVEQKIRTIAQAFDGVTYLFNNWAQANVNMDRITGPTIIYVLPPSGDLNVGYARVKDYPQSQIAFVASTRFEFATDENDNIIEQMKRLCIRFIKAVNDSGWFELIEGNVHYQVLYDHLDENVTGVVITPELKEIQGINICCDYPLRPSDKNINDD